MILHSVFVILAMWHPCTSEPDTSAFKTQIDFLANDMLGVDKFQNYLGSLTYTPSGLTNTELIQNLRDDLIDIIEKRVDAVQTLQTVIQDTYSTYTNNPDFTDCCLCCTDADEYGSLKFHTPVNTDSLCYTGEDTTDTYPNTQLMNTMNQNFENNPNLKWQYFGGEDGVMSIYPNNKACDEKFDPRFRPWYSSTAFTTPKDIVVIIDRSGSMDSATSRGRTLMEIAKEAAETVIDTLNPDDRVGVVFFSNEAQTLQEGCFTNTLAVATADNKDTLKDYVETQQGNGGTYYGAGFSKAFEFFTSPNWKSPVSDDRKRLKVILFLTDGQPTDKGEYMSVIGTENAKIGNEAVILTFGFGDGIGSDGESYLTEIAAQAGFHPSAGPVQAGRYVYVSNADNLRTSMARYYDFFSDSNEINQLNVAVPYLDAFGLGFITSICLPVHVSNTFKGVTCIDITISDLFDDVTYFSQDTKSYAFIADGQSRLLVHPLLPRPSDVYEDPILLHVQDLEVEPDMAAVVDIMMMGRGGSASFSSRRVLSRGESEHDGVDAQRVSSTYLWEPLGLDNLTVCIVLATHDTLQTVISDRPINTFPYHRLDLTQPDNRCRYLNRVAITDSSTIKFAPYAFLSPENYIEQKETATTVQSYESYFLGSNDAPFKSDVKEAVAISGKFDEVLGQDSDAWRYSVWRYIALKEGVFRIYPGHKLVKSYDASVRPWYKKALSQKELLTFSKPYVDAFGAGIIITMSKALFDGKTSGSYNRDDPIAGAMAMDFTMELFNSMISNTIDQCQDSQCFMIDNGGYVISHPDFVGVEVDDYNSIQNIHITQKESAIANTLYQDTIMRKDQCINFNELKAQSFWRVLQTDHSSSDFDMVAMPGTNMYVIVKKTDTDYQDTQCQCPSLGNVNIPQCGSVGCQCPCYSYEGVDFDACDVTFSFDSEIGDLAPCTPPAPPVNLSSVAEEERDSLVDYTYCYPVETVCPSLTESSNCSATAGCLWCEDNKSCLVRSYDVSDCSGSSGGFTAVIIGIVVALVIVIIIVIIVVVVVLKKKGKLSRKSAGQSTGHSASAAPTYGHTNPAVQMETRPPATAPDFTNIHHPSHNVPHSQGPEPPPSYVDSLHHPSIV